MLKFGNWFEEWLVGWTRWVIGARAAGAGGLRRRLVLTALLVGLGVVFSWMSRGISWQADVLEFFSADSAEVRAVQEATAQPGLASQLRMDVHARAGAEAGEEQVIAGAKALAESLRGTGEFRTVWTGAEQGAMAASFAKLVGQGPAILTREEQGAVESRADPEQLRQRFAEVKRRLADPDGEIQLRQLAADPLGIGGEIAHKVQGLSPARGAALGGEGGAMNMREGVLLARDPADGGLHAMVVTEPRSMPSDQEGSMRTLAAVDRSIAEVRAQHPSLEVWVVGAHRGYVENAQRVMRDVSVIGILGSVAVALAIFIYFRRIWPAVLCLIPPSIGVGVALGLAGSMRVRLPLILLGFIGLLCGSTTDYGIQIIAECRRLWRARVNRGGAGDAWDADLPARAAARMAGPITMSVATSVTGFAALGLSASPGLRALGLFVAGATVCIWAVTFFVLPACLGPWVLAKDDRPRMARWWENRALWWVGAAIFALVTLGALREAGRVEFDRDPRRLDGTSAEMRRQEEGFYRVWGNLRNRAIVQVGGSRLRAEAVLARAVEVDAFLQQEQREGMIRSFISPVSLLSDARLAGERMEAWRAYWTAGRREELRRELTAAARANGMKPEAFAAYADRVGEVSVGDAATRLRESPAALFPGFVAAPGAHPRDGGAKGADEEGAAGEITRIAMMVNMNVPTNRNDHQLGSWAGELRLRFPEGSGATVRVLSGGLLMWDATERARAEGERFGPWCILAIVIPLWIYFARSGGLRRAWLVMLCLAVGFLWVLGAAELFGHGLNLLSLVPVLFTLGVAVDYGIYAASAASVEADGSRGGGGGGGRAGATFMCALTTLLGSGSLALAVHPAMRWLGITLVAGIAGGYLTSLFVVGPLVRRKVRMERAGSRGGWRGILDWPTEGQYRTAAWRVLAGVGRIGVRLSLLALTALLAVPVVAEWRMAKEKPAAIAQRGKKGSGVMRVEMPVQVGDERWYRVGGLEGSWMRWRTAGAPGKEQEGIWEIMLRGNAEARGRAISALAGPIDLRIENEMLDQLDAFLPQEWARWLVLRGMGVNLLDLPAYVPEEYQEEIYWAAVSHPDAHAYLAPTYPRILSYHALHDVSQMLIDNPLIVPNTAACTGVVSLPSYSAAGGGGHLLLARNFDFEGGESFGRQKSVTLVAPERGGKTIPFAHVAWPGLSGVVTGMNAERIAIFLNAAATKEYRRIGTPTIFMARQVLEQAHNLAEAQAIIEGTQVFVSDIVVVADGKTGEARVFEKSPGGTASYSVSDSAVVANHLVTERFAKDAVNEERKREGTTMQRYARARQLLDGLEHRVTPEALAALLRDKKGLDGKDLGYGNRNAIDGLIACHGVVMDATAGKMWVASWPYVEGAFIEVNVLEELSSAVAVGHRAASGGKEGSSASTLAGEDSMMSPISSNAATAPAAPPISIWDRVVASREAARRANDALREPVRLAEALQAADEEIRNNPAFYEGYELRGRALLRQGNRPGAKAAFSRAMELDPPYAQRRAAIEEWIRQCEVSSK